MIFSYEQIIITWHENKTGWEITVTGVADITEEQNDISYFFTLLCTNTSIAELGVTLMSKLKQERVQNTLTETEC